MVIDDKPYLTLASAAECEIDAIKGSRFIGLAVPITSDEEAVAVVDSIKQRFADARHWCWAYQLLEQRKTRFNDDGEPNGSAGKPILAPLQGRDICNAIVVVVRYFGGVKLGVGGLVRAYSQASNAVLDAAEIIEVVPKIELQLCFDYSDTAAISAALASLNLVAENTIYTDHVTMRLKIQRAEIPIVRDCLTDYTAGRAQISVKIP